MVLMRSVMICGMLCQAAWAAPHGLIVHYNFTEGSGPVVKDQSGRGNDAEVHGATWEQGAFGAAMRFDGQDDYLDGGIRPDLEKNKVGSIVIWIRPESLRGGLEAHGGGSSRACLGRRFRFSLRVRHRTQCPLR